ncbi:MAG: D-alanine--D-alanine ligase [Alphaproteobacteria bacterium]|nr:D-alanine--D-alanine ligase [Alphaproteobacteria bacterium]
MMNGRVAETKVLVVMGGTSAEREVSLATGRACAAALDALGCLHTCHDFRGRVEDLVAVLQNGCTVMLNCLHGTYGEDGRVQAVADLMAVPYSHSGVLASAVAMHKAMSLDVFRAHALPIARSFCFDHAAVIALVDWPIALPLVVKPVAEGSSIGVQVYEVGAAFADAYTDIVELAQRNAVLFEEFIPGRELTVAVAEDGDNLVALGVTELVVDAGFYDYRAKYDAVAGATHICPANIPESLQQRLYEIARTAHQVLGLRGVSRSDFRYDPAQDRLVILEINTQPGMTETSLLPEQAALYGWDFPTLIHKILAAARHD